MRIGLIGTLSALLIASPFVVRAADTPSVPDEKTVDALVEKLASDDFTERQAASDKLLEIGPEIVRLLEKYRRDENPEVRARVNVLLRTLASMQHGAIITAVTADGPGSKLGLIPGDVIVKADDQPLQNHGDLARIRGGDQPKACVLILWREGRIRRLDMPDGLLGIRVSNWDLELGGGEQSRALMLLSGNKPDRDQAYRKLKSAQELGMKDSFSLEVLACLAARALDGDYAEQAFKLSLSDSAEDDCTRTHQARDGFVANLPYNSLHTKRLLDRYKAEPYTPDLAHNLEDWAARQGRNGPLLSELLQKPWTEVSRNSGHRFYHDLSLISWAMHQRDYAKALEIWRPRHAGDDFGGFHSIALQSAVRTGNSKDACAASQIMLESLENNDRTNATGAFWGLASSAAANDQESVELFLATLDRLSEKNLNGLTSSPSVHSLYQPAASRTIRKWVLAREPSKRPAPLFTVALADLVADSSTTAEQFDSVIDENADRIKPAPGFMTALTGRLRFGQVERAKALLQSQSANLKGWFNKPADLVGPTLEFIGQNQQRFNDEWKDLRGCIQVTPAKDGGKWVLRYDGQIYHVDNKGKVEACPGLPPPPTPASACYAHLWPRAHGVVAIFPYGRQMASEESPDLTPLVYLFDQQTRQWTSASQYEGPLDFSFRPVITLALVDAMLDQTHPKLPGAGPRMHRSVFTNLYWYEGDILVFINPNTHEIVDLSAEIGKQANRDGPAHLYHPEPISVGYMLFSDSGVWTVDSQSGKMTRIPLGLANENVITCSVPPEYARPDKTSALVGVAPQMGGQIFVIDTKTTAVTKTKGYCGVGPRDWFAFNQGQWGLNDPQAAIYAVNQAEASKQKQ